MKFRTAARRSVIIVAVILLSLLCGYLYHVIGHRIDLRNHPRAYEEIVTRYAAEYGVPDSLLYAVMLKESGFVSNAVSEDGKIGLMQMTPETFQSLCAMNKETLDSGLLYDPDTNIRYGAYRLSYLFTNYGRWTTVLCAVYTNEQTVNGWLNDPANVDENGMLTKIPNAAVRDKVNEILEISELYQSLYDSDIQ